MLLVLWLSTISVGMAQLPFTIDPDSVRSPTREDFEKAVKAYHGMLQLLTGISEIAGFNEPKSETTSVDAKSLSTPMELDFRSAGVDPTKRRAFHYQDTEVTSALLELARLAKRNVAVAEEITGRVTVHFENKTPWELFEIICTGMNFANIEKNGVYYVRFENQLYRKETEAIADRTKRMFDAYIAKGFSRTEAIDLMIRYPKGLAEGLDHARAAEAKPLKSK